MKICRTCGEERPLSDFHVSRNRHDGRDVVCRFCRRTERAARYRRDPEGAQRRTREWNERNPERVAEYQRRHRLRKLGVAYEDDQFDRLLVEQDGRCAICGTDEPGGRGGFHVDHDHETGQVRGLLCDLCNRGLGYFADDVERLLAAVDYLRRARPNRGVPNSDKVAADPSLTTHPTEEP